jgi:UDP-2,4-diacetamido-2,4,6-trideoxy-beta-L-altropyranose hydrolase
MQVVFRVDASILIGTGHVMRCLTLAEALRQQGASCRFVCREHPGSLIELIRKRGFFVCTLPVDPDSKKAGDLPSYAEWLGGDWRTDATQTILGAGGTAIDWLVVDHYALDARWERALAPHIGKLMVIDDLADRPHDCDLLLDQTYGREVADYRPVVPADCRLLCGSQYALLRPDFAALRSFSLKRRARPFLREFLITMGGVDKGNATGQVLQALRNCPLPADCRITVVMGAMAPWLTEVHKQAQDMPWPTRVLADVSDMAQVMVDCDLAIGAAGATSWERCCLGVPTIMLVLAENQCKVAQELERSDGVKLIKLGQTASTLLMELVLPLIDDPTQLLHMSKCAARIVDGSGVKHVMLQMEG